MVMRANTPRPSGTMARPCLTRSQGLENNLRFEVLHRDVIARFGRYPHRNAALGRVSTPGELAFMAQPGSSF